MTISHKRETGCCSSISFSITLGRKRIVVTETAGTAGVAEDLGADTSKDNIVVRTIEVLRLRNERFGLIDTSAPRLPLRVC